MSEQVQNHIASAGVEFATVEDAGKAAVRIAADRSVNGTNPPITD